MHIMADAKTSTSAKVPSNGITPAFRDLPIPKPTDSLARSNGIEFLEHPPPRLCLSVVTVPGARNLMTFLRSFNWMTFDIVVIPIIPNKIITNYVKKRN